MQRNVKHVLSFLVAAPFAMLTSSANADIDTTAAEATAVHMATKSRAEVRAEFLEAQRKGLLPMSDGDFAQSTSTSENVTEKSRAQVRAGFIEAQRLGLVMTGDGNLPQATPEQERQIALAGRRAVENVTVAKRPYSGARARPWRPVWRVPDLVRHAPSARASVDALRARATLPPGPRRPNPWTTT